MAQDDNPDKSPNWWGMRPSQARPATVEWKGLLDALKLAAKDGWNIPDNVFTWDVNDASVIAVASKLIEGVIRENNERRAASIAAASGWLDIGGHVLKRDDVAVIFRQSNGAAQVQRQSGEWVTGTLPYEEVVKAMTTLVAK